MTPEERLVKIEKDVEAIKEYMVPRLKQIEGRVWWSITIWVVILFGLLVKVLI